MAGNLEFPYRFFDAEQAYETEDGWMLYNVTLKENMKDKEGIEHLKGDTYAHARVSLDRMEFEFFERVATVKLTVVYV